MKSILFISLISLLIFGLFTGCASKLYVKEMVAKPSTVNPGDNIKFYVILSNHSDKVAKIVIRVREYPSTSFTLNNIGERGDEKPSDNIWTYQDIIPWDAPSCELHLDISILDEEGNLLISDEVDGKTLDRSGTILINIE